MSGVVKVAEKLDWGSGPYFQLWFVCGFCDQVHKSEEELINHKVKVHLDSEQRRRYFQKKQHLERREQRKNEKESSMSEANITSSFEENHNDKRMKDAGLKSLKKESVEGEEDSEAGTRKLRRSSRPRKRKENTFITWEEEVLWEAKDKKNGLIRNKEKMKHKSQKLDLDFGRRPRRDSSSSSSLNRGNDQPNNFKCSICLISFRMTSYRDKHEREAHRGHVRFSRK